MIANVFMPDSPESKIKEASTFDPSIQTENIAYSPDKLLECEGCSRQNPPNRTSCIYCGRELAIKAADLENTKPVIRKLDAWESGFNIIFRSVLSGAPGSVSFVLPECTVDLDSIVESSIPLPIARVESLKLAEILVELFDGLGLRCTVVSDADLSADRPPIRLRRIVITDRHFELIDFNANTGTLVPFEEIALIVAGQLSQTRTEMLEKRRRKAGTKVMDEMATSADESILDIYTRSDRTGFRVYLAGFDFSCLGDRKGLLAGENMRRLSTLLADTAPNARVIDNYARVRHLLSGVWDVESRTDPQGLKRSGFGKVEFGKVETTSNLEQFNKYSRLQWHLL